MAEMRVHKKVFPFICGNSKCKTEYNIKRFTDVALFWGFIYLTDRKNNLIGITCPDCHHTTVRKYTISTPDFSPEIIEEQGTSIKSIDNIEYEATPNIKQYVPFSINILEHFSLIDKADIKQGAEQAIYKVPFGFEPVAPYSPFMRKELKLAIQESSLRSICDIENKKNLKALPRIVDSNSIYKNIDTLLFLVSNPGAFSLDEIDNMLTPLILPSDYGSNNIPDTFKHMVKNNLSLKEFRDMDFELMNGRNRNFSEELINFLKELTSIRNRIDCEIIFRDKVINKYARILYYSPGLDAKMRAESYDIPDLPEPIANNEQTERNAVSYSHFGSSTQFTETDKSSENNQKGIRSSTIVKNKCQKKAEELWEKARINGDYILSSGEMAEHPEVFEIGKYYQPATIQRWLSKVAPFKARQAGVRPKKKQ